MNLVASLIVRNEADRYLGLCLDHLCEFVDEIRLYDDGSTDDTASVARRHGTQVLRADSSTFYQHEGQARQRALEWTLEANPTHVLNIDADEFIEDGPALRKELEGSRNLSWRLCMEEVWKADENHLHIRMEPKTWQPYLNLMVWSTAQQFTRIQNKQLACGRTPMGAGARSDSTGISVLHFGWACEADRQARYDRYVVADGGRFHASAHLESIMWPDARVRLEACPWPAGLRGIQDALVERANKTQVPSKGER